MDDRKTEDYQSVCSGLQQLRHYLDGGSPEEDKYTLLHAPNNDLQKSHLTFLSHIVRCIAQMVSVECKSMRVYQDLAKSHLGTWHFLIDTTRFVLVHSSSYNL